MAIRPRLAVVSMVFQGGRPNVVSPLGDLATRWMFGSAPTSIASCLRDASSGLIDVSDVEFFGMYVINDPAVIARIASTAGVERAVGVKTAIEIARGSGAGDLRRFDGLIFMCLGGRVDAGATSAWIEDELIPVALLDEAGEHSFIAHEVSHVVGFKHSYRSTWINPEGYLHGEYGDPVDLMSAKTFGNEATPFGLSPDASADIVAGAPFWGMGGPGFSPAILWRYLPGFSALPTWASEIAAEGPAVDLTLRRPGLQGAGPMLAVMRDPQSGGWWTAEYRPAISWDQGLAWDPASPAAAPGIVIHRVRTLGHSGEPSYPRPNQVDYIGTLPVPTLGDDDWDNGQFAVRVLNATKDSARVLVGRSLPSIRSVRVGIDAVPEAQKNTQSGVSEFVPLTGAECTGAEFELDRRSSKVAVRAEVDTAGFAVPAFSFEINSRTVRASQPGGAEPDTGIIQFPALVWEPTGLYAAAPRRIMIAATWIATGDRLVINLPRGHGRYTVSIRAKVAETGTGARWESAASIEVITESLELPAAAVEEMERCLQRLLQEEARDMLPPRVWPRPPEPIDGPDWSWRERGAVILSLRQLRVLEQTHAYLAGEALDRMATDLAVPPAQLADLAVRIERLVGEP